MAAEHDDPRGTSTGDSPLPHQCAEAYRHMRYGTKDGSVLVSVWNSRDGVTPFGFTDPDTGAEVTHLPPWQLDHYDPSYVPEVGEWMWVDLHPERALQMAMEKVEQWWDDPKYPLSRAYETKREAAEMFLDSFLYTTLPDGTKVESHAPDLVRVTEPLLEQILARLEEADA